MDVSFSNVVEGTRQYFLGLPKASPSQSSAPRDDSLTAGQPFWSDAVPPAAPAPSEGALAQSGAPAMPNSRPPSVAAAHPPPRPASPEEPLEPEPHIIHKATVMREALEKQREEQRADRDESGGLSPPTHIIHKPPHALPAPEPPPQPRAPTYHQYRSPSAPASSTLHYPQTRSSDARSSPAPAPSPLARSPHLAPHQTYARSSTPAQHARSASPTSLPPQQHRYPPVNDRVPPILHPSIHAAAPPPSPSRAVQPQRLPADSVTGHAYGTPPPTQHHHHHHNHHLAPGYERHQAAALRKQDAHAYPGFAAVRPQRPRTQRPSTSTQPTQGYADARLHVAPATSHAGMNGAIAHHYPPRPPDGTRVLPQPQNHAPLAEASISSGRGAYRYAVTSTQNYSGSPQGVYAQPTAAPYRAAPPNKPVYDSSPPRGAVGKSGFASHQPRPTVSVTSIVDQMNQTKQKRESPLDLSVKTVKNSADSTAQDESDVSDAHDRLKHHSSTFDAAGRQLAAVAPTASHYVARSSHKVDFSPNFHSQYVDKSVRSHRYTAEPSHAHTPYLPPTPPSHRVNGTFENTVRTHAPRAVGETYIIDNRYQPGHPRYTTATGERIDHPLPRIDLTRAIGKEQYRDTRPPAEVTHFAADDTRKRLSGSALSNVPPKIVRYETWSDDSRIEHSRLNNVAQEQHKLMSQPVYSYSSHKQYQAYQNEQRRASTSAAAAAAAQHYRYPGEASRLSIYDRKPSSDRYPTNARNVIQKAGSQQPDRSGVPADKRVLSILRNSLETRSLPEPRRVTELIVIEDDTPEEAVAVAARRVADKSSNLAREGESSRATLKLQMPRAVDSIRYDSDSSQKSSSFEEFMAKQKKIDLQHSPDKNTSPDGDVASRIRTKAELKGFTLPTTPKSAIASRDLERKTPNLDERPMPERSQPTSQKAHLFRQLYEENEAVRLESVIKKEIVTPEIETLPDLVKSEPMNIEEIEKDAIEPVAADEVPPPLLGNSEPLEQDLDWSAACDSFMEQLKTGCSKKKTRRKRADTVEQDRVGDIIDKESKSVNRLENSVIICNEPNNLEDQSIIATKTELDGSETSEKDSRIEEARGGVAVTLRNEESTKQVDENKDIIADITEIKQENIKSTEVNDVPLKTDTKKDTNIDINNKTEKVKMIRVLEKKRKTIDRKISTRTKELNERRKQSSENVRPVEDKQKNVVSSDKKGREERGTRKKSGGALELGVVVKTEPVEDAEPREPAPTREQLQQIEKSVIVNVVDIIKSEQAAALLDRIKQEPPDESTDDDEPLINSKLLKDKHRHHPHTTATPRDPKTLVVKLECCDSISTDLKNTRNSISKETESKSKLKPKSKLKGKAVAAERDPVKLERKRSGESSADSEGDEPGVASRLRVRKLPADDTKTKSPVKCAATQDRKEEVLGATPRKPGFGDGSDFHPGWEEEVYKYKRSLRMPSRLIRVPRSPWLPARLSSSLPDLDPPPVSPAPSSCAATAPLEVDRAPDSDLDSNSSFTHNRLCYDSEASCSTVLSYPPPPRKKNESILDILIQKYGRKEESKKKHREEIKSKETTSGSPLRRRDPEPSAALRRTPFTEDVNGLKKSKQRASIKEVFGDERPASAPPTSCRDIGLPAPPAAAASERPSNSVRPKNKKLCKERLRHKSGSIRDGLRSTSLKKSDAKGRLLRLKKRNNLLKTLSDKRPREGRKAPPKRSEAKDGEEQGTSVARSAPAEASGGAVTTTRKRLKRLFARRKLSSGFDYIRKKKKLLKRREDATRRERPPRPAPRHTPESVHDVHKEIKGWFINKSVGETPLHRAARLGYTDCVAYCLEKLNAEASARDNAGFTPLHVAAARGHLPIARLLLQYGANVSAAAQGGIRPLHEASENEHVEMVRLLLSFGADPLLATYAGQTPAALAECAGARASADLLRGHVADVQGATTQPWLFTYPVCADVEESGCDALASPPPSSPPPPDAAIEIQCTDAPLPPFYSLKPTASNSAHPTHDGLWCLLQDVTSLLQIKSRDSLLKQIHCGAGSPRELLRELRTSEFLERAQCHQLLGAGEKVNVRASKVALVRLTDKLRQLLRIETTVLS